MTVADSRSAVEAPAVGPSAGRPPALHRVRLHLPRLGRFAVVGAASFVVELALFNLLVFGFGVGPVTSKVIATLVAMVNAYLGNRFWSFRDRPDRGHRRTLARFAGVNAVGLAIGAAVIGLARYGLDMRSLLALNLANLTSIAMATAWRFGAYHKWVFAA